MKIYYNSKLKQLSRVLRNNRSTSEALLWNKLKGKKIYNSRFTRQKPIGNYVVDFYCSKLKLVIEVDGHSHIGKHIADEIRQKDLERIGLKILRFSNAEVMNNMDNVLKVINCWIKENTG